MLRRFGREVEMQEERMARFRSLREKFETLLPNDDDEINGVISIGEDSVEVTASRWLKAAREDSPEEVIFTVKGEEEGVRITYHFASTPDDCEVRIDPYKPIGDKKTKWFTETSIHIGKMEAIFELEHFKPSA